MSLTPSEVTTASRVMLPTYVVLFTALGINYSSTGERLLESPALAFAAARLPLPAWGAMFLATAAVMAVALLVHQRTWFRFALWVGIVCMSTWAAVFATAAYAANASPTAAIWPGFVAVACYASDRSLLKGETS